MKVHFRIFGFFKIFILFLMCILSIMLQGCHPDAKGLIATPYHDIASRFNYEYMAEERILEMERKMRDGIKDDYNYILQIYPVFDSIAAQGNKGVCEDIITKSSRPVQWHRSSKWADNCFILIGKSRFYMWDLKNAIETFKYVNSNCQVKYKRHWALISLIHAYMAKNEIDNAESVADFIRKEKIDDRMKKDYFLTMAHFYAFKNEPERSLVYLRRAVFLIKGDKNYKARIHFTIAQLAQKFSYNPEAYYNYKKCIQLIPSYEMDFHSRLFMAQTADFSNEKILKKTYKQFKKMLSEDKNVELKGKIYYEIGKLELKRERLDSAISNFTKASKAPKVTEIQKAYSFFELATIYYEKKRDYILAYKYYDSTASNFPKLHPEYKKMIKRKEVLAEFVKEWTIYKTQDSLLLMSKLDTVELNIKLDKMVLDEKERIKKEFVIARKLEKEKNQQGQATTGFGAGGNQSITLPSTSASQFFSNSNNLSSGKWYFYNNEAIENGKNEFTRTWGSRVLEDNWRMTDKEQTSSVVNNNESKASAKQKEEETKAKEENLENLSYKKKLEKALSAVKRENFMKDMPNSPEKVAEAEDILAKALFNIAKIYKLKLDEPIYAIEKFEELINRAPHHERTLEALYLLYLSYKQEKNIERSDYYKKILLDQFPESLYAKIIINPDYVKETNTQNKLVSKIYQNAYQLMEIGQIKESDSLLTYALAAYPKSDIEDKIWILKIKSIGKSEAYKEYVEKLEWFIQTFPKSLLIPQAESMLKTHNHIIDAVLADKSKKKHIRYHNDP